MIEFTPEQLEEGRRVFAGACDFTAGVATLDRMPEAGLPEVAFAGRSNVGKSSLINALTGRHALARTSNTPGRTQQLNFFKLGDVFELVDMPGYGYAKVSKQQKKEWEGLIRAYLRGRPTLRCAFVLIDARHGIKESDEEIMDMLGEAAVSYRIVLTKMDKASKAELEDTSAQILAALKKRTAGYNAVFPTSADKGTGIPELRAAILEVVK